MRSLVVAEDTGDRLMQIKSNAESSHMSFLHYFRSALRWYGSFLHYFWSALRWHLSKMYLIIFLSGSCTQGLTIKLYVQSLCSGGCHFLAEIKAIWHLKGITCTNQFFLSCYVLPDNTRLAVRISLFNFNFCHLFPKPPISFPIVLQITQ